MYSFSALLLYLLFFVILFARNFNTHTYIYIYIYISCYYYYYYMTVGDSVVVDGNTIKQMDNFVRLGGAVFEDAGRTKETQTILHAEAASWRRVEGIMRDRKLKKQPKRKVMEACIVQACVYDLKTFALIGAEVTCNREQLGSENV